MQRDSVKTIIREFSDSKQTLTKLGFLGMPNPIFGNSRYQVKSHLDLITEFKTQRRMAMDDGRFRDVGKIDKNIAKTRKKYVRKLEGWRRSKRLMKRSAPWTAGIEAPMAVHDIGKAMKASRLGAIRL